GSLTVLDEVEVARRDLQPARQLHLRQPPFAPHGAHLGTQSGGIAVHKENFYIFYTFSSRGAKVGNLAPWTRISPNFLSGCGASILVKHSHRGGGDRLRKHPAPPRRRVHLHPRAFEELLMN